MLPLGHVAGGYLAGSLFAKVTKSNVKDGKIFQFFGMVGGLLPDLDLVVYHTLRQPLSLRPDIQHHTWLTHTFPFYIIPGSLMAIWTHYKKLPKLAKSSTALTTGACVHLVQDMFESGDGIPIFFPL